MRAGVLAMSKVLLIFLSALTLWTAIFLSWLLWRLNSEAVANPKDPFDGVAIATLTWTLIVLIAVFVVATVALWVWLARTINRQQKAHPAKDAATHGDP
jgi:hypothetical protein